MNKDLLYKICENPLRKINNLPLSCEDFFHFLFPGKLIGDKYVYDMEEYENKREKLVSVFGDKEAEIIHSAGMALAFNYASKKKLYLEPEKCLHVISKIYADITNLPIETLTKPIGAGYTGLVFMYSSNKVIKLMFNSFNTNELKYFSFQIKKRKPLFPEIFDYGNDYMIMEKLEMSTFKLFEFREGIKKYIIQIPIGEQSYREVNPLYKNSLPMEIEKYLSSIRYEFKEIFGISSIGDLKDTNIGERSSTGEFVYFDPIGSLIKES